MTLMNNLLSTDLGIEGTKDFPANTLNFGLRHSAFNGASIGQVMVSSGSGIFSLHG